MTLKGGSFKSPSEPWLHLGRTWKVSPQGLVLSTESCVITYDREKLR